MVKFGLVHRSAMNVRAVPPCAGEDARATAGETPALRSSAESYGHSRSRRHMRTCGRRLLTRDAVAHCIQIQAAFFRDFDCRANTFASKRWHHNPALLDVQNDCAFRWGIRRACTCTD